MENFEPIDINFLINSQEVKADAKKVKDELQGISDVVDKVENRPLKSPIDVAGIEKQTAAIGRQKRQYDGLGNSIAQITRELPAFTLSAQTGFLAISNNLPILADEITRLKVNNEELVASGGKAKSVFGQVAKSFLSWNTVLSVGVTLLTIYGAQIFRFLSGLVKSKSAIDDNEKSVEALNKAYESTSVKKAVDEVVKIRAAFAGAGSDINKKREALELYNKSLGNALGTANSYNEAEKLFRDKSDAYVKALLFRAAATAAVNEASKELLRLTKEEDDLDREIQEKGGTRSATASFASQGLREEKQAVQKEGREIEQSYNSIINRLNAIPDELARAFDLNLEDPEKTTTGTISKRKELLEKLADIDAEYVRKQLDTNAEEIKALKDKFGKIRKLVDEFNADPKNASVKIDLAAFNDLEARATAGLRYEQDTDSLKQELAKQKQLFEDFEEYKKQFGIAKAKESFAEELKEFQSYGAFIQKVYSDNAPSVDAFVAGTATGAESDRVNLIIAAAEKEQAEQVKNFNKLLADLQTYEQERKRIISDSESEIQQLLESGEIDAAGERAKKSREALRDLDESYAESTQAYKDLVQGVEGLSDTAAKAVIASGRRMVASLAQIPGISQEILDDINAKIDELEQDVAGQKADRFFKIANGINDIAGALLQLGQSLEDYDEGLADTITTIGELGQVAADVASSVGSFASGDIAGGIASAISAIAGVFSIGARARKSAREAQAELNKIQQEGEDGERRLNALLRERNIERSQEVELTLKGIAAQREALKLAQQQQKADEASLLAQLQQEQFVSSSRTEKFGGFLGLGRKTRVVNEYGDLLGLTFDEIEALYERGNLNDRAKELFEQLRDLREEGQDINGLLSDLQNQANEIFTGTTSDSISDSIIKGLRNGYDSFEDFGGDVERILQNAILNGLKYSVLEEPVKKLYEQFAADAESDGGLSDDELQAFRDRLNETIQTGIDNYKALTEGLDLSALDTANATGLTGAIRRELTEETASELTGLFRGQFDITKRHFQLHERHFDVAQRNYDSTIKIMGHTALIEQHTRNTVLQLEFAVTELKTIGTNTKPSQTARDLGLGG